MIFYLDFFENYIKPGRPFMLKGEAMKQPAYELWTDEYIKSFPDISEEVVHCKRWADEYIKSSPEASKEVVQSKQNLKEKREEATGFEMPMKEFISRYHNERIYMVNRVPTFMQ